MSTPVPDEYQTFTATWNALSEESRSRFIAEFVDELLYFDLNGLLMPGPGYGEVQS
jgi:hypothetical protein